MQALLLTAVLLTTHVHAHMRMRGPLPQELLEHSDDVEQLKKYAGLDVDDSAKGLFGLHYYYTLNVDAQKLTLKLLNSNDSEAQQAALGIIAHCGGATAEKEIFEAIRSRLGTLSASKISRIRRLSAEAKRALRLKSEIPTTRAVELPNIARTGRTGITVGASMGTLRGPLDTRFSLRFASGTLQSFFDEVSNQTNLKFQITQGLERCEIAAFIHDLTAREVLQMTIGTRGITYQQLGRSNEYTITRWHEGPQCPPTPSLLATGKCISTGGAPISLECKHGPLTALAALLYEQSDASIIVWNEAVQHPISIRLERVTLPEAINQIRKDEALAARQQVGESKRFVISMQAPQ